MAFLDDEDDDSITGPETNADAIRRSLEREAERERMSAPMAAFCCSALRPPACIRAKGRTLPAMALGRVVGVNQRTPPR